MQSRVFIGNRPSLYYIGTLCLVGCLTFITGIFILYETSIYVIAIILFAVGIILPLGGWYREYCVRPISLKIIDEGLNLGFRNGKSKLIRWEDEFALRIREGNPDTVEGRWERGGTLEIKNQFFDHFLTYEMARAIERSYFEKMGDHPPREVN